MSGDCDCCATRDTANENCRILLDVLMAQGVDTIVISPGSRNTPLTIGAAARPELRKYLITDERTAAFTALGIAMASQRPVALACTSGTALYDYAPAIAEAYYQKIPLIVITADRPAQWIDQDDSQTLHQYEALDKIVKRSYDIYAETGMSTPCANPEYASEREWFVNRVANEAVLTATHGIPGPVHINMQFGNPLNHTTECCGSHARAVRVIENESGLPPHTLRELSEYLRGRRIMVVAGFMQPDDSLNRAVADFARLENVTVLCETISNLHLGGHAQMIDSLLTRLTDAEKASMHPDVVISIGGSLVSRMLKEYIRSCNGAEHWTLADTPVSVDCFQRLTTHVDVTPRRFFKGLASMSRHIARKFPAVASTGYREMWQQARERVYRSDASRLETQPWSELKALAQVFRSLPRECDLFLSNGTCVRYAQLLLDKMPHACRCNRGVSGIDGTNATAFGNSLAYRGMTLLVTGDMSFAYCPEVMNLRRLGGDLRIVVVNNAGGGIFRFIGTTRELDIREQYFCCDPQLPVKRLTEAYGWNYRSARNETELEEALRYLLDTPATLLEIQVDPQTSADTLINWLSTPPAAGVECRGLMPTES